MFTLLTYGLFYYNILAQEAAAPATPIWLVVVLAVVGSSALATLINVLFNRTKTKSEGDKLDADAAEALSRTAAGLVKDIQDHYKASEAKLSLQVELQTKKIDELSLQVAKIPELQASVIELTRGIEALTLQLLEHDIRPVYPPLSPAF